MSDGERERLQVSRKERERLQVSRKDFVLVVWAVLGVQKACWLNKPEFDTDS